MDASNTQLCETTVFMAGKFTRVEIKAAEYGRRLESNYLINNMLVDGPPKLRRMFRVRHQISLGEEVTDWRRAYWPNDHGSGVMFFTKRRAKAGEPVVSIERGWQVNYGKAERHALGKIWKDIRYAQAERDALGLAYARHLMLEGT